MPSSYIVEELTQTLRHPPGRLSFPGLPCDGPDMTALSKYADELDAIAAQTRSGSGDRLPWELRRLHHIAVSCNLNPRLVPVASCRLLGPRHRLFG
jgi:hypothetical protein